MFFFETLEKDADKLTAMPAKTAAEAMVKTRYDQEELGYLLDNIPTEACKDILDHMDEGHKDDAIRALAWSCVHRCRPHSGETLNALGFETTDRLALYKLAGATW